jgi:hypothetical protein
MSSSLKILKQLGLILLLILCESYVKVLKMQVYMELPGVEMLVLLVVVVMKVLLVVVVVKVLLVGVVVKVLLVVEAATRGPIYTMKIPKKNLRKIIMSSNEMADFIAKATMVVCGTRRRGLVNLNLPCLSLMVDLIQKHTSHGN